MALPLLDAMVPALTAQARSPFRFGAIYMPNGVFPATWHPDQAGSNFEFKPVMQPLEPFRDQLVTVSQMKAFLMQSFGLENQQDEEEQALSEVNEAVDRVMSYGKPIELAPQAAHIRRLQHLLIEQHGLGSESRGEVPWRRVVVLPTRG